MTLRRRLRERGAAAVEFALILPVLVLVLGGIIDFGRFFFAQNITVNAAREGARMMALGYPSVGTTTTPAKPDAVSRVQQAMISYQGNGYTVDYTVTATSGGGTGRTTHAAGSSTYTTSGTTPVKCPEGAQAGDQVTVKVSVTGYSYFLLRAVAIFGSGSPPVPNGTATMRCGG